MVNTILKYIGSSIKASLSFVDDCKAPAFRLESSGEIYYGEGVGKEQISINDSSGNQIYIRLLQPETASEVKRISSCEKKFNYQAKCRLVYFSFTDDSKEWPIDKRKQAIKNVLTNLKFTAFKEMSSDINISINSVNDNFEKVFKAETNQDFEGGVWPTIIAVDFTINYKTSTNSECQDLCVNSDFSINQNNCNFEVVILDQDGNIIETFTESGNYTVTLLTTLQQQIGNTNTTVIQNIIN
ncbi:MAG: hypothetical protein EKK61_03630 [Rickettsiales bacterium]|nr:MAG: hypothetical protein EKK61_03630 [Rickettsiales bacterium]